MSAAYGNLNAQSSSATSPAQLSNSSSRCEYINEDFACSYSIPLGIRHTGLTEVGGKEVNSMFEFVKLFCLPQTPSRLVSHLCSFIHFISMKFPRFCAMGYGLLVINTVGVD